MVAYIVSMVVVILCVVVVFYCHFLFLVDLRWFGVSEFFDMSDFLLK